MTLTPTAGDAAGALRALITGTVTEPPTPSTTRPAASGTA